MFRDREDAARRLAAELRQLDLNAPVVLGVPRGGVATAAVVAEELDAEMDVVLARKLRHPLQPELAIGSVSEDGEVHLNESAASAVDQTYLDQEREERFGQLQQRREMFRQERPPAELKGRSVVITDDGIATGSTILAATAAAKSQHPREVIVAVPVAPSDSLEAIRPHCDRVVCLSTPSGFMSIGQFYEDFHQVENDEARNILRQFAPAS